MNDRIEAQCRREALHHAVHRKLSQTEATAEEIVKDTEVFFRFLLVEEAEENKKVSA